MTTKRKLDEIAGGTDEKDYLSFIALGGGNEVGRSCHIIEYRGKTVMLDAGVHPAYNGLAALPFYDEYDLSTVDILLISHFHLDHAASLPYVMQKTDFKGRVFMTHPTKAIYKWLLSDFVRVSNVSSSDDQLYDEKDLIESFDRIEAVDYHSTVEVEGVKFTPYHAGHVLGAAMYFIEIAGVKILFTGDYSREEDRHLNVAEIPPVKPDILITESTYGTASHQPRAEKESRLTNLIHSAIRRGGRVLMPMFALGNTQEILLILDEYWQAHPDLHTIPIYYASALARKCMAVYQTYVNVLNDHIRMQFKDRNPFIFRHVTSLRSLEKFHDVGPCVMLASPGMLQNGVSRELLEKWAPDPRNALIVAGFSVEGTMAKHILNEPLEIQSLNGQKIPRRISVEEISFAAHVDYVQNSTFIEAINAPNIILVHGEQNNMGRLKSALLSKYSHCKEDVKIFNPRNCEMLKLHFRADKIAKAMGSIAKKTPQDGEMLEGVLIQKDFNLSLMHAQDLRDFSGLATSKILERQSASYHAGPELLKWHFEQMFGVVGEEKDEDGSSVLVVMEIVRVKVADDRAIVEWEGNVTNDSIADTVLAIIIGAESSPASVKREDHNLKVSDVRYIKAQFGTSFTISEKEAIIEIDTHTATVNLASLDVTSAFEPLRSRIKKVLEYALDAISDFSATKSNGFLEEMDEMEDKKDPALLKQEEST